MEKDVQQGCTQSSTSIRAEDWPGYSKMRPGKWKIVDDLEKYMKSDLDMSRLPKKEDVVNHPNHYCSHPSGIECIQVTEHLNFCIGNAIKYLWRAGLKDATVQDLEKAKWYIEREIKRISK